MHNKTLYRLAKRLSVETAMPSLRFNFRGTGLSLGRFDNGIGEVGDVQAAIDALTDTYRGLPVCVIGYSFGAVVALRAGVRDPRVNLMVALGMPLTMDFDLEFLQRDGQPRLFVQGEKDEFGNSRAIRDFVAKLPGPVDLEVIGGADHLFRGAEDEAVDAVVGYIQRHAVSV